MTFDNNRQSEIFLQWHNLNYTVNKQQDSDNSKWWKFMEKRKNFEQKILINSSGTLKSGNLIAILGSSGSGKTTLLSSVSQRIRGNLTGEVLLNQTSIDRNEMAAMSGFLAQHDTTIASLTPLEHLWFMCELKMERNSTKSMKLSRIDTLLRELGIENCRNTRIEMMSGGERKKLCLATELITEPPLLFCDEPTTGLDSYNALSVIQTLQNLTKPKTSVNFREFNEMEIITNDFLPLMPSESSSFLSSSSEQQQQESEPLKAVMCSIHQPTSGVFELFSHIILMHCGRIVYQGSSDDAKIFFTRLGFNCPTNYNPADYYMNLVASEMNEFNGCERNLNVEIIANSYNERNRLMENEEESKDRISSGFIIKQSLNRQSNWFHQVYLLTWRSSIEAKRTIRQTIIQSLIFLTSAVILSALYSSVDGNTQAGVQDIQGVIFLMSTEIIFTFSYNVVYVMPTLLPIIRRETGERLYKFSAFYVSTVISLLPSAVCQCIIFLGLICSVIVPFQNFWIFIKMVIAYIIAAITATAYGLMLSGTFESIHMILEMAYPMDFLFLVLGGFYVNLNSFPYLKYVSVFYFTNECVAYQYWRDIKSIECSSIFGHPCMHNGTEVLQENSFGTTDITLLIDYGGIFLMMAIMHILGYLGLIRIIKKTGFY